MELSSSKRKSWQKMTENPVDKKQLSTRLAQQIITTSPVVRAYDSSPYEPEATEVHKFTTVTEKGESANFKSQTDSEKVNDEFYSNLANKNKEQATDRMSFTVSEGK